MHLLTGEWRFHVTSKKKKKTFTSSAHDTVSQSLSYNKQNPSPTMDVDFSA